MTSLATLNMCLAVALACSAPSVAYSQLATLGDSFQISRQGRDDDVEVDAIRPTVTYNPIQNEFLATWTGDRIDGEREIYGQRLDSSGHPSGESFRISVQGPDGDIEFDAWDSAVAYNSSDNEYLVTWFGHRTAREYEIYGQRLDGGGIPLGDNFQISMQG
ncbi:MAG: hypothetical protein AAF961_01015, partial [Planctomycetota bacterium]